MRERPKQFATFNLRATMPLDAGFLQSDGTLEVRFRFEEDGTYEYLQPWFLQVRAAVGKYVDRYGDATFDSSNGLLLLMEAMGKARAAAEGQPPEWKIHSGTQLRPVRGELYRTMKREFLLDAIDRFRALLQQAAELDRPLLFRGD